MEYTKEQRKSIVCCFKYVKKKLESGATGYICIMLEYYTPETRSYKHWRLAQEIVQSRINAAFKKPARGRVTPALETWIVKTVPQELWDGLFKVEKIDGTDDIRVYHKDSRSIEQMRLFRIRWLKELIREFS